MACGWIPVRGCLQQDGELVLVCLVAVDDETDPSPPFDLEAARQVEPNGDDVAGHHGQFDTAQPGPARLLDGAVHQWEPMPRPDRPASTPMTRYPVRRAAGRARRRRARLTAAGSRAP